MITFRHTVSAIAVSSLLVFGACKKKETVTDPITGEKVEVPVNTADSWADSRASASDIKSMLTPQTPSSSADADKALEALGMTKGSGAMSWDTMDGGNGNYNYSNLSFTSPDGDDVKINSMKVSGVHMDGNDASFDRLDLSGVSFADDEASGSIGSVTFARPHPKVAARVLAGLSKMEGLDDLDMDVDLDGELPFGAMYIEGVEITGDDNEVVNISSLGWGIDEASGKASFLAENITVNAMDDGKAVNLTLKSASAKGITSETLGMMSGGMQNMQGMSQMGDKMNPMGEGLGNVIIEGLNVSSDTLQISVEALRADSKTSGDVTTSRFELLPMTMAFSGPPSDSDLMEAYEALSGMGMERMVFTGRSTTTKNKSTGMINVDNGMFSMQDGFDFAFNFKGKNMGDDPDNMEIHGMSLALTDKSIVDKAFEMAAKEQGGNASLLKMQAIGGLAMLPMMAETPDQQKIAAELGTALKSFLQDGGTLVVNMNPPSPLSSAAMEMLPMQGAGAIDALGLSVSHRD